MEIENPLKNLELSDIQKIKALGMTLSVTTEQNEHFIGDLFYFDNSNSIMILKENHFDSTQFDYRLINQHCIKEIKILKQRELEVNKYSNKQGCNEVLKNEENIYEEIQYGGNGNMKYKQFLIQELKKMYEVDIQDLNIVLNDLYITIKPPYKPENCEADEKGKQGLERIKTKVQKTFEKFQKDNIK